MHPTEIKLTYLEDCHYEKSKDFNNTKEIPQYLVEKYKSYSIKDLWDDYLKFKFKYLLKSDKIDPGNKEALKKSQDDFVNILKKEGKEHLTRFIADWEKSRSLEEKAFFVRYTQWRDQIIYKYYYSLDIKEIDDWRKKKVSELKEIEKKAGEGSWQKKLEEMYKNTDEVGTSILDEWYATNLGKRAFEDISFDTTEIAKCDFQVLEKFSSIIFEQPGRNDLTNCQTFLASLSFDLIQNIYPEFDENKIIKQFLKRLKDRFRCEVCDYLESKENGLLIYRTSTVDSDYSEDFINKFKDEDAEIEIKNRESYKKGEGISGSISYYEFNYYDSLWHHIGSNDVENDPRQSPDHKSAYERDIYPEVLKNNGKINNFWSFPVTSDGKLIGCFRVVNKLDSEGKLERTGWKFFERVELTLIALWFSKFLDSTRPLLQHKEDFLSSYSWSRNVDNIIKNMKLEWINKDFLKATLTFFQRILSIKEEKRRAGATVLITDREITDDHSHGPYPFVNLLAYKIDKQYEAIIPLLDAIDPLRGAFLFDVNGNFRKIVTLEHNNFSEYDAIIELTKEQEECIGIVLPHDTRNILLYQKGERIAELFQAERTGKWQLRNIPEIKKIISDNFSFDGDHDLLVDKVLNIALGLSQRRSGGLVILGDVPEEDFNLETKCKAFIFDPTCRESIKDVDLFILLEYAKIDGAIIIDSNGCFIRANTFINPRSHDNYRFDLDRNLYEKYLLDGKIDKEFLKILLEKGLTDITEEDNITKISGKDGIFKVLGSKLCTIMVTKDKLNIYEDLGQSIALKGRGGRHQACEKVCRLMPNNLGLVISENGGISIVKKDKALYKEDYEKDKAK